MVVKLIGYIWLQHYWSKMTKLSDIQTEKQKLEGEIKDSIARRRPIENCVRSYDNVIDNEWCNLKKVNLKVLIQVINNIRN